MCVLCNGKPFGFSAASLTRRHFVAGATALGGAFASAKVVEPIEAFAESGKADIIIENAKIITLDPKMPLAQAVAISGDKVIGIGPRRDVELDADVYDQADRCRWPHHYPWSQ